MKNRVKRGGNMFNIKDEAVNVNIVENPKSVVQNLVDKLLIKKTRFDVIMTFTGWTSDELWLYIDMIFRNRYPDIYSSDKRYYCQGIMNDRNKIISNIR